MNRTRSHSSRRSAGILLLASVLCAGAQPLRAQQPEEDPISRRASDSRVKGAEDAPVTVFELADFECPFCARFALEVAPRIDSAYVATGKVRWVFVNYPLPMHERAWVAAEAALCAGAAGGDFWHAHHALFGNQQSWGDAPDARPIFRTVAAEAGADPDTFSRCAERDEVAAVLAQDLMSAARTGATGTPAFIVNQQEMITGLRSYEEWQEVLERALEDAANPQVESSEEGGEDR